MKIIKYKMPIAWAFNHNGASWDAVDNLVEGVHYEIIARTKLVLLTEVKFVINGTKITLPCGYQWNGASIPKACWWWIAKPDNHKFALASLVHDALYDLMYDRKVADDVFYSLLRAAGVGSERAATMWAGVRVGGWVFYKARKSDGWFWSGVRGILYA